MLDRFLVIAEGNDLEARIVINKVELVDLAETQKRFADYLRAGYTLHFTSVKQRVGLDELHDALAGRTSVLSGPSGVGKSSLMNSMYPGLNLRVGEISESVNKGRHTTVGAICIRCQMLAMWSIRRAFARWVCGECHPNISTNAFRNSGLISANAASTTAHIWGARCTVAAAVEAGEVSRERYESYAKLRSELEESEKMGGLQPGCIRQKTSAIIEFRRSSH